MIAMVDHHVNRIFVPHRGQGLNRSPRFVMDLPLSTGV
jgi:hypothetical protein